MAILGKILYGIGVVFGGFGVICTIVVVLLIAWELAGAQPPSAAEEDNSSSEATAEKAS